MENTKLTKESFREFEKTPEIVEIKRRIETGDIDRNLSSWLNRAAKSLHKDPKNKFAICFLAWILINYFPFDDLNSLIRARKINLMEIDESEDEKDLKGAWKTAELMLKLIIDNNVETIESLKNEIDFNLILLEKKSAKVEKHFFNKIEELKTKGTQQRLLTKYSKECLTEIADYLIRVKELSGDMHDWLYWWNKVNLDREAKPLSFKHKTLCVDLIIKLTGSENKKGMKCAFRIETATPSNKKQPFNSSMHGKEIIKIIQRNRK